VAARRNIYREDLDIFDRFCRAATGFDPAPLDASPGTAGISNGVIAPVFVRERPWGLISVVSSTFRAADADAVALFATHVGSALEVALFIEELSTANANLHRAQKDLVERERLAALGELGAIIAHEVRNPLGVIFNAVSSLRRSIDRGSVDEAGLLVSIVEEEAARLNGIVSDLLELARPTNLRLATVQIKQLVEAVVANVAATDEAKKMSFAVDVARDIPPVEMDPRLMRQALFNLVLNAVQASGGKGSVAVHARVDHASLCLEVTDEGPGIPFENRARIFEPFFTTKPSGTGLGLALVKRVVETHGGALSLRTSTSGTTFGVVLPLDVNVQSQRVPVRDARPTSHTRIAV
jgi:signal transduction histidine kinase